MTEEGTWPNGATGCDVGDAGAIEFSIWLTFSATTDYAACVGRSLRNIENGFNIYHLGIAPLHRRPKWAPQNSQQKVNFGARCVDYSQTAYALLAHLTISSIFSGLIKDDRLVLIGNRFVL